MSKNKWILIYLLMMALPGCKPSANAGYLPPMTTAPIESGPEAAINNSTIIDNENTGS